MLLFARPYLFLLALGRVAGFEIDDASSMLQYTSKAEAIEESEEREEREELRLLERELLFEELREEEAKVADTKRRLQELLAYDAAAEKKESGFPQEGYEKKIWVFWNYPNGPSPFVRLNYETWVKHAPDFEIVKINDTNIAEYVPDLPQEYYRLPYASANSDFIRAALLYHHGGVYMDTDFMLMHSLEPVEKLLETSDVVGYKTGEAKRPDNSCTKDFSSNFMAGRKHNRFSKTWWENIKMKMTRVCPVGGFKYERVCCHEDGAPEPETRSCHIPWAQLEHMKLPEHDHDKNEAVLDPTQQQNGTDASKLGAIWGAERAAQLPNGTVYACLTGPENLAPQINGEIYWQRWNKTSNSTVEWDKEAAQAKDKYDHRFDCKTLTDGSMQCEKGFFFPYEGKKKMPNFFGRVAYHLFFSTRSVQVESAEEILGGDWLISEMYRRSLGI